MFKKGRGARLAPVDLKRFGRRFIMDLEAILPGQRCRLVPLSGWPSSNPGLEGESLVLPLNYRGRELGYLLVSPVPDLDHEKILSEMVRQGLETMWLRKALLLDRETGLFSRDYLKGRLPQALRRRHRPVGARSLSLAEANDFELMLVMAELREAREPRQALLNFAARLSGRLPLRSLSRLSSRRLAFLVEGRPEEVRLNLENALDDQLGAEPGSRPVAGWSRWPGDLEDTLEGGPSQLRRQALEWWEKADVALFYARQSRGAAVGVAFGDLINSHGQVIQVLPLDRVIINLGRTTGAAAGQVFLVNSPVERPGGEPEFKGDLTIFETSDSYSLATARGLKPFRRIVAGDRLTFSRRDFDQAAPDAELNIPAGFLAKLPARDNWLNRLEQFKRQPLALALARLDGYEKTLAMLGRTEGDRLLNFIFEKVRAALPDTALSTLWQPDLLALAWPGGTQAEIKPAAHRVVADLKESGPVSIGLVFSAGADSVQDLVEDGRKALNEAAFTGPGQVAVFGPLALNISGDRLFEGGDLTGALREYERGLALAPDHLNLLNSLGVCQGRLGNSGEALATFEKITRLDPQNMMAHYNLGYTHLLSGRLLEAEEALGRAAELDPDNFETLFHLGKTALELGHLDRALPALKRAGEMGNTRPAVFRLLGEALMLAHDHQGALAAFKKAVKATPNDAYALSALGALFVDLANDLPVARSLFQRSVEIDPTNSLYRQRLGRLLFTLDEYDGAEHHLKMAMEYGSRSPEVHYHLGCLAEENGRREEALTHFRAALEQDPAYKPALEKIG